MTGREELIASELNPGVRRVSLLAFEVPDDIASGRLVFKLSERGLLGTGSKRVLLLTPNGEKARQLRNTLVRQAIPALRKSNLVALRALMTPDDRAATNDTKLSDIAQRYNAAVDQKKDRLLGVRYGGFREPSCFEVGGEGTVQLTLILFPKRGK